MCTMYAPQRPHTDYILYDSVSIKFQKKQNKLAVVRG